MADAALSITAPSLASIPGGSADSVATTAGAAAETEDPFAALLADAGGAKDVAAVKAVSVNPVAALLADGAPVFPPTTILLAANQAVPPAPTPAVAGQAVPTADIFPAKPDAQAKDGDAKEDEAHRDTSKDPLADAIANGATAVLAFAPAIVAPVQQQIVTQTPVRIDAPTAPKALELSPTAIAVAKSHFSSAVNEKTAAQPGLTGERQQADPNGGRGDRDAPQQLPTVSSPATPQLSPDAAKAVAAALDQAETAPNPAVSALAPATQAPSQPAVVKMQGEREPAAQQVQQRYQPAPPASQTPPPHRRGDETPALRRADDTRRRTDPVSGDVVSIGLPQSAPEAAQAPATHDVGPTEARGDTLVQQTLSIARDGAWLDRLAKDIASAGNGGDLHFKLEPRNLGSLGVAISQTAEGASIRFTADKERTRDILIDAQPKLIAEARAQGVKISDTHIDVQQEQKQSQNQSSNPDSQRWPQNQAGQNGQQGQAGQNGQNRQFSPGHQPFVSNLGRKATDESESSNGDSDALYA